MRRRVEEQIVLGKCVAGAAVPEHAGWATPSLSVPEVEFCLGVGVVGNSR